jgi:hypothetical protein
VFHLELLHGWRVLKNGKSVGDWWIEKERAWIVGTWQTRWFCRCTCSKKVCFAMNISWSVHQQNDIDYLFIRIGGSVQVVVDVVIGSVLAIETASSDHFSTEPSTDLIKLMQAQFKAQVSTPTFLAPSYSNKMEAYLEHFGRSKVACDRRPIA